MKYLVTVVAIHEVLVDAKNKEQAASRALDNGPSGSEVTDVDVVSVERYREALAADVERPIDKYLISRTQADEPRGTE